MTSVALFEGGAVPAHLTNLFGDMGGNDDLSAGVSAGFPIISYKGKVWRVNQGGNSTLITNDDGEPRGSLEVVIVKANPHISKVYYAGGYEEGSTEKPTCFSHDGVVPEMGSTERQAERCAVCPRNTWGSRITENGAKGKECADSRRLAVVPSNDLALAMLLRVPAGSLKELMAYADMLNKRRTPYQAVVTKIGFDHNVAHQKLTFKAVRWLDETEARAVAETLASDTVAQIVGLDRPAPSPLDELGRAPAHVTQAAAPEPKPAKATPKHVATASEVSSVLDKVAIVDPDEPTPAALKLVETPTRKADPAPEGKTKSQILLEEADASLESVLAGIDFDD